MTHTTTTNPTKDHTMKKTMPLNAILALGLLLALTTSAETVLTPPADLTSLTARQRTWHEASTEARKKISEAIGENGAADWAKAQGYEPILDHNQKQYLHGADQIYRTPEGNIICIEAKGGTSPLGHRKGLTQGTPEYAVEAAADMLKSRNTTPAEKKAAALVLQAAKEGKLEIAVIHTEHTYGEPKAPKVKEGFHFTTDHPRSRAVAARAAAVVDELDEIFKAAMKGTDKAAQKAAMETVTALEEAKTAMKFLKVFARVVGPLFVIIDLYSTTHEFQAIEAEFAQGRINEHERMNRHAQQVAGMLGGWADAAGGAWVGAAGGAAAGAALGSVVPIVGSAIGGTLGGIVGGLGGGICGYYGGDWAGRSGSDWILRPESEAAPATGA